MGHGTYIKLAGSGLLLCQGAAASKTADAHDLQFLDASLQRTAQDFVLRSVAGTEDPRSLRGAEGWLGYAIASWRML